MSPTYIKTWVGKTGKRYRVYWRPGGRAFKEQYAGSFKTMKEARARRDFVAGELANGRDPMVALNLLKTPAAPRPGLAQVWDAFIASRVDVGDKARAQYRNARDRWTPILGTSRELTTVTSDDVIAGIADLHDDGEGLAASTIGQYVSNLALVFDFAGVEPNPVRSSRVKLPRGVQSEKAIPGHDAWFAIRDHAKKRSKLCLRLMEACALRVTEATSLEWGDLDFVDGAARIRRETTKTASGRRWVPVPRDLLDELQLLLPAEDRDPGRRVLPVDSGQVRYDLVRASVAAGAPQYGTHALRHRRISLWLRLGIDPVQASRWAGHSKPSESTDTYGHVVLDVERDEWAPFWRTVYRPDRAAGAAPVRHGDTE